MGRRILGLRRNGPQSFKVAVAEQGLNSRTNRQRNFKEAVTEKRLKVVDSHSQVPAKGGDLR